MKVTFKTGNSAAKLVSL